MPDLESALRAKGYNEDVIIDVAERAAIIQYDAGKTHWKASVDAQKQVLGEVVATDHDL